MQRALKRAEELDEHLKTKGKVVGPLHGLPVSLKDQIRIKNLECTMGESVYMYTSISVFRCHSNIF